MKLRVYKILEQTKVEGPDNRFCIWVQGCPIHCPDCWAKDTWSFEGGRLIDINLLYEKIISIKGIEGVTFLGGEPFFQAREIYELCLRLKKHDLGIMIFTGYDYIVNSNKADWIKLLSVIDLLVDGPFKKDKFDLSRPWVGSSNQKYRFLTSRYDYIKDNLFSIKNKVEVRIEINGQVSINGMGNFKDIREKLGKI